MASKTCNDEIIDPNGLDLFRLTMMVITASICGGIFSLAGDMAAGGANTGAVIVSWGICFIGVFALMMVFNGFDSIIHVLTQPRVKACSLTRNETPQKSSLNLKKRCL